MGRRSGGGTKTKKRKKVLVTPAMKMQDGKLTEPYQILADLVEEHRCDLKETEIVILWRAGWRADPDGWTQMVNVKKAGDVDRALSVKADFALLLNKEQFPKLPDQMKRIYIHHALEHMQPLIDSDGEQKQDDKGRKLWRVKKRHDVEQFGAIVKLYGEEALTLDSDAIAAIKDADRPLLAEAEKNAAARGPSATAANNAGVPEWHHRSLAAIGLDDKEVEALEAAGITTAGQLAEAVKQNREYWRKELKIDRPRKGIVDRFVDYLCEIGAGERETVPYSPGTPANNAWRSWPISTLGQYGLPAGKVKLLEEAFDGMGKLVDRMNRQGAEDHWWKDIKGFGESGYDALVDAMMALRKDKPEFQQEGGQQPATGKKPEGVW